MSIKQSGNKIGAYSSIRFIKFLIVENREKLNKHINNIEKFEELIDLILGNSNIEKNSFDSLIKNVSNRKTYKNLFSVAENIGLSPETLSEFAIRLVNSDDEIKILNQFAIKIYDYLNGQKWFIEIISEILKIMNFIQCKLIIEYDDQHETLQVNGVEIIQLNNANTFVEISGRKSYFSNVLSTGHGGFLLKYHNPR